MMMANSKTGLFGDLIPGAPSSAPGPSPRPATPRPAPTLIIPGKDTGPAPKDKFADQWRVQPDGSMRWGQVNLTTNQFTPYKDQPNVPKPITKQERMDILNGVVDRIIAARKLRENTKGLTGTGTFGEIIAGLPFGATRSREAKAAIDYLTSAQTYDSVMKMQKETGGKNPFAPMTEFESKVMAGKDLPPMGIGLKDQTNVQSSYVIEDANRKAGYRVGFSDADINRLIQQRAARLGQAQQLPPGVTVRRK
jgi:hypothetical protein